MVLLVRVVRRVLAVLPVRLVMGQLVILERLDPQVFVAIQDQPVRLVPLVMDQRVSLVQLVLRVLLVRMD